MRLSDAFNGPALAAIPILTGTLLDNAQVGTLRACVGRVVNTGDTSLPHRLGRVPNGYLVLRSKGGGVLYDGTNAGSDWTSSTIVLRSTLNGETFSFLLW